MPDSKIDLKAIHRICGAVIEEHTPAILDAIRARIAAEIDCEFRIKHFRGVMRPGRHVYLIETGPEIVHFPKIDQELIQVLTVAVDAAGREQT